MTLTRAIARPLLAASFISGGISTLRNPQPRVEKAEPVAPAIASRIPTLPQDTDKLVRINAIVQVVAGLLLAISRFPRLAATALAASLVPTTLAGHRFWEAEEPQQAQERIHFLKNVGMLGGLILASVDTEGAPSLGWRARRAGRKLAAKVS